MKESEPGYHLYGSPLEGLDLPAFAVSKKWTGADLQTMRNTILGPALTPQDPGERLYFEIGGGQKITGSLHAETTVGAMAGTALRKPLVLLVHGLNASEETPGMLSCAAHLVAEGFPVLRLSQRGAGPSAETSAGPVHAGLTEDLIAVLDQLPALYREQGVFLLGFSLGGNIVLKYLGEAGKKTIVRGAVTVSAPLNLAATERKIMTDGNRLYHNYILQGLKAQVRLSQAHHPGEVTRRALAAESLREYDEQYVARLHGLGSADDYYASQSADRFLMGIRVPTLMIHAENDPWVPVAGYQGKTWPEDMDISVVLTRDGGHLGFHAHDHDAPWQDRVAGLFFDRCGA